MKNIVIGIILGIILGGIVETKIVHKKKLMDEIEALVKRIGVMNLILLLLIIGTLAFVLEMIELFKNFGATPDVLISCFFVAVTGEAGIMGWIKTSNERKREREWQIEDEKRHSQSEQQTPTDN